MKTKTKEPNITRNMIKASEAVFLAMAATEMIRPIVLSYQKKILNHEKYEYSEKQMKRRGKTFQNWIMNPKDAWLMSDDDFTHYASRCNEERIKVNLHVDDPGFCPLLVAEDLQRKAENSLIKTMQPITHVDLDDCFRQKNGLETRQKLIDLILKLICAYCRENNIQLLTKELH